MPTKSLVVYSGGQDSTTCLHWSLEQFDQTEAIFFDYQQRHALEKQSAQYICNQLNIPLHIYSIPFFSQLGGNSLVDEQIEISNPPQGLPNTFVPGRNLIFLTKAAALAYTLGIQDIITGVCQTDYSGYPDCRKSTLDALENTLSLGMECSFKIHTPLMYLSKAESILLAQKLGAMPSLAWSHTCYEGVFPPCGKCPACILREKGFAEAKIQDPLIARAKI